LDKRLRDRKARETGICAIREELYAQCLDELIRQITICCSKRGLLLVRVRDEMRMTIQAYQNLYESALSYGMRKALQGEQRRQEMEEKIKALQTETLSLENEVENIEESIKKMIEMDAVQQEKDRKAHEDEVNQIKSKTKTMRETLEKKLSGEEKKKQEEKERKEREKKEKKEKKEAAKKEKAGQEGPEA
jgi:dynein light intermediate chain